MSKLPQFLLPLLFAMGALAFTSAAADVIYPTLSAAQAAGAVHPGRVPAWLPQGTIHIREAQEPDSQGSTLSFQLPLHAGWPPASHCHPEEFAGVTPPPLSRPWWPSITELEDSYVFYSCFSELPSRSVFVGVHQSGRRAVLWRGNAR